MLKPAIQILSKRILQKLVETEQAFARFAEEKGTKAAFLEYLADDGIVFQPTETNGKFFWKNRPESTAWLNWSPAWADLSSDGNLGYTTGGWSFHPKGKTDKATAYGEYLTIWKRQPDGNFKAVLDIGISHKEDSTGNKNWKSAIDAGSGTTEVTAGINNGILTDIFSKEMLSQGYFNYFADDVVVLRDGHEPFSGKTNAFLGLEKADKQFPPKSYLDFKANVSQSIRQYDVCSRRLSIDAQRQINQQLEFFAGLEIPQRQMADRRRCIHGNSQRKKLN